MTDVAALRQSVDLLALVERDTRLKRAGAGWWAGPCPFCGGRDRFVVKQTPDGWRWLCRHCTGGRYLDVVDYIQRRDGLDFKAAVQALGGASLPLRHDDDLPPMRPPEPPQEQDPQVIERLTSLTLAAVRRRLDDEFMRPVFEAYLQRRGLTEETADAAMLGVAWAYDRQVRRERPAMAIPYCDGGFRITAVKFRFVDDEPNGFRYTMAQGSKPGLYGLWQPLKPLLILTEGEINALSVWQTLGGGATVLSCGGQTNHLDLAKRLLVEARKQGIRTFVWFDDLAIAKTFQPVADKVITSPLIGKTKYDANAMLQDGVLDEFLKRLMEAEHA